MIYHITSREAWDRAFIEGRLTAPSLQSEGFIHCSTHRQVERSLRKFFAGETEVFLLEIDPDRLDVPLKYEPADGDSFPHLYGPLSTDAVVGMHQLRRAADEEWTWRPPVPTEES